MKQCERRPLEAQDRDFIARQVGYKQSRIWGTVERNPRQFYATSREKGDGKTLRGR